MPALNFRSQRFELWRAVQRPEGRLAIESGRAVNADVDGASQGGQRADCRRQLMSLPAVSRYENSQRAFSRQAAQRCRYRNRARDAGSVDSAF
jgi:hypothetical protein